MKKIIYKLLCKFLGHINRQSYLTSWDGPVCVEKLAVDSCERCGLVFSSNRENFGVENQPVSAQCARYS
jgi:hypothetical protein